tara:strand:+ start:166 stop:1329 length:1164 start_codon:yes stop_codon:yes gene_type:complete
MRKNKIIFASNRIPTRETSGGASQLFILMDILSNDDVSLIYLLSKKEKTLSEIELQRIDFLKETIPNLIFRIRIKNNYFDINFKKLSENEIFYKSKNQKLFVFDDEEIKFYSKINIKKTAWPDDPIWLLHLSKAKCNLLDPVSRLINFLNFIKKYLIFIFSFKKHLSKYNKIIHQASHHSNYFKKHFFDKVSFAPPIFYELKSFTPPSTKNIEKIKLLHIGHLGGAATLAGLDLLINNNLIYLSKINFKNFEVNVVGKLNIPVKTINKIKNEKVNFIGFADDLDLEIKNSDALIVPSDHSVGTRTRILDPISFGVPIVAHKATLKGMPYLTKFPNVFIYSNSKELHESLLFLKEYLSKPQPDIKNLFNSIFTKKGLAKEWFNTIKNA